MGADQNKSGQSKKKSWINYDTIAKDQWKRDIIAIEMNYMYTNLIYTQSRIHTYAGILNMLLLLSCIYGYQNERFILGSFFVVAVVVVEWTVMNVCYLPVNE